MLLCSLPTKEMLQLTLTALCTRTRCWHYSRSVRRTAKFRRIRPQKYKRNRRSCSLRFSAVYHRRRKACIMIFSALMGWHLQFLDLLRLTRMKPCYVQLVILHNHLSYGCRATCTRYSRRWWEIQVHTHEIALQDDCVLVSFNVCFLFASIPVDLAVETCRKRQEMDE